jgi:histidyl-tRNA synthetase
MTKTIVPKLLKGFRDFNAPELWQRQYLLAKIITVFERFGFEPLETPALEYLETFIGNIGEDEKLFFNFKDKGGREVALRYDQTVPACRYIAKNINKITLPFKRYQLQPVWRAEKPQRSRYRELLQCDADIFGVSGYEADAEMIALTVAIYQELGFSDFVVKINDRSLFKDTPYSVIVAIDKIKKIGEEGVLAEIVSKGFSQDKAKAFLRQIKEIKPNQTLNNIFAYLKNLGIADKYYQFAPEIARSFSYSTGPIWEVVIPKFGGGSVLGGERFDNLVGRFINRQISGSGFGLGFDRTLEAMQEYNLLPIAEVKTKVLVTIFCEETLTESLKAAAFLRSQGINTEIYSGLKTKLDRQLKYANSKQIPYCVIIGPEEVAAGKLILKNMSQRTQQAVVLAELIKLIKS